MINLTRPLTIAIPTGRMRDECINLLTRSGYITKCQSQRQLFWSAGHCHIIEAKPVDVPVYVQNGVADCGLVGKDILLEIKPTVYELLDCQIGKCHLALAQLKGALQHITGIASKYKTIAADYCHQHQLNVPVIHLHGSVEIAPLVGLANTILDIVDTGTTIRANGLAEIATLADITVRFIVNKASYQLRRELIENAVENLKYSLN